ncbi:transcription factor MAMYB [Ricinus communis]|uniref:DNA binding protein, putative n=1 Tax=Ricinus communis TaxID=3988 RepID=B9SS02_RICCO|nr:transcription factor MAMYB [Ricinus communis]XP_015580605.1 transcription factor MAMYB [Ricinus communis]EEF33593.1 DNA binding protein, putative [Ricinus communis]|eukprot:XP_002528771.1 transcription factor MAMYB [Ricinus communis]
MEFIDEDARPRFVFQSRPLPSSLTNQQTQQKPLNKPLIIFTVFLSSFLFVLSILYIQTEPFKSLLFWVSISFIVGPFAPSHITGGDIRVGQGPIFEPLEEEPETVNDKRVPKKRSKQIRSEETVMGSAPVVETTNGLSIKERKIEPLTKSENWVVANEVEKEWNEEDLEILKKQMVKNPVGKPRRWEVIAEAFKGRHKVESVIKMAKEMGERKLDDNDSYARFLKNRKPLDTRAQAEISGIESGAEARKDNDGGVGWNAVEDIALLNALKAFPKDIPMRWEKIAAAVPTKSKAACMKRIAELKKDFRSSKAAAES